ncbi:hypothetical protein NDU88_004580 [Pleurodeles waltl]|uniref:Uncharacterized protein n=1 Tax=Pleurodeles waltl TaxID=8319 RepID=A0AAV7TSU5_PLEWA|nr:hypothetical protein NDU88_004580 [Pleurodeles waltl]
MQVSLIPLAQLRHPPRWLHTCRLHCAGGAGNKTRAVHNYLAGLKRLVQDLIRAWSEVGLAVRSSRYLGHATQNVPLNTVI